MAEDKETVTISKSEYQRLLRADRELSALHAGGVDNWEWYGDSLRDAGFFSEEDDE